MQKVRYDLATRLVSQDCSVPMRGRRHEPSHHQRELRVLLFAYIPTLISARTST